MKDNSNAIQQPVVISEKYKALADGLRARIAAIEVKTNIFADIKKNKRSATLKETEILDSPTLKPAASWALSNNEIALVLEAKANKRNNKYKDLPTYEPFVLDNNNMGSFFDFLSGLPKNQEFHYDVILKTGAHCTPLQIHSDGKQANIFYADAVGAKNNEKIKEGVESALGAISYSQDFGTQKDRFNCSIFSLQDLNSMKKMNPDQLRNAFKNEQNPRFYKNSQTMTLIKNINHGSSIVRKNGKSLDDYIADYSITVDVADQAGAITQKKKNYAILLKSEKYLKAALATFEEAAKGGDEVIDAILSKRNGQNILNSAHENLSIDEKKRVEGLYHPKQIELLLKHGIDNASLKNLRCFKRKEMGDKALEYIVQGNSIEEKNARIELLKLFGNIEELTAVIDLNLTSDQVFAANCFSESDKNLSKKSLRFIKAAYDNAPGDKAYKSTAASKALEKIADFRSSVQLELITKYGVDLNNAKGGSVFDYDNPRQIDINIYRTFVQEWYKIAGAEGANAATKSLNAMTNYGEIKNYNLINDKNPTELQKHFKDKYPELAQEWEKVNANIIAADKSTTAEKKQTSSKVNLVLNEENAAPTIAIPIVTDKPDASNVFLPKMQNNKFNLSRFYVTQENINSNIVNTIYNSITRIKNSFRR